MSSRRSRSRGRGCGFWLLLFFGMATCALLTNLWGIPRLVDWMVQNPETLPRSFEATNAVFDHPVFGPEHVFLSLSLQQTASEEDISEDNLKAIVAAAASQTGKEGLSDREWQAAVYKLAADLLGIARTETHYCINQGDKVSYDQIAARLEAAPEEGKPWWQTNLDAVVEIAAQRGVTTDTIKGGDAGELSCFQMMPRNWLTYGGGDYSQIYQAANNAARFLMDHGYQGDPSGAIHSYNGREDNSYVEAVEEGAGIWIGNVETVKITEPLKIGIGTYVMQVAEFVAWYSGKYKVAGVNGVPSPPVAGQFVHPCPGYGVSGYDWLDPVYIGGRWVIDHPGVDYGCKAEILSAHDGVVTYAGYVSGSLAIELWISGNVVIVQGVFSDGTTLCSFYGHGAPDSIGVTVGQQVSVGEHLMDAGSTGWSTGVHLHFAIRVEGSGQFCRGGVWVNPHNYIP